MRVASDHTVHTASGRVRGLDLDGVHAFLAIPYASPPVGALRFAAPAPSRPWAGVRPAVDFGPTAPQPLQPAGIYEQILIEGDGYLHLNVHTPSPGAVGLPVLVWIHGGGMAIGSNVDPSHAAARLARRGMVVVSINYRLGADGFLVLRDAAPNRGVLDWVAALEWVQANIAAFGGDPDNVTIGGQSAGSAACLVLATIPRAAGLFHRVFAMSGVPWNIVDAPEAAAMAVELASRCGVDPTTDGVGSVPREQLFAIQQQMAPIGGIAGLTDLLATFHDVATVRGWLGPVVDGQVVPERPLEAIRTGAGAGVALLIGSTAEEMDALIAVTGGGISREQAVTALARIGVEDALAARWLDSGEGRTPGEALGAALTALSFRLPALRVAEARVAAPAPTFVYEVTWRPPTPIGAVHGFDIAYAFDSVDGALAAMLAGGEPPRSLADNFSGAVTRFVLDGDPGWPRYDDVARQEMAFDVPSHVRADPARVTRAVFGALR